MSKTTRTHRGFLPLIIETGRYTRPHTLCDFNVVEDEYHFNAVPPVQLLLVGLVPV